MCVCPSNINVEAGAAALASLSHAYLQPLLPWAPRVAEGPGWRPHASHSGPAPAQFRTTHATIISTYYICNNNNIAQCSRDCLGRLGTSEVCIRIIITIIYENYCTVIIIYPLLHAAQHIIIITAVGTLLVNSHAVIECCPLQVSYVLVLGRGRGIGRKFSKPLVCIPAASLLHVTQPHTYAHIWRGCPAS